MSFLVGTASFLGVESFRKVLGVILGQDEQVGILPPGQPGQGEVGLLQAQEVLDDVLEDAHGAEVEVVEVAGLGDDEDVRAGFGDLGPELLVGAAVYAHAQEFAIPF